MGYPADPPTVEEIVAVMRHAPDDRHGWRVRAMIVVLWRGGLRIQEALAVAEHDLDPRRGSLPVRTAGIERCDDAEAEPNRGGPHGRVPRT
jgi:site-specific recombinase XerD